MTIIKSFVLFGKVILLLTIIVIFSYVNINKDRLHELNNAEQTESSNAESSNAESGNAPIMESFFNKLVREDFTSMKEKMEEIDEAADGVCEYHLSTPFSWIVWIVSMILYGVWWVWVTLLRDPIDTLLSDLFGKAYVLLKKVVSLILKLYIIIIKLFFKIFRLLKKLITKIFDLLIRLIFKLFPTFLLDILAYFLAIPIMIFGPIIIKINKYLKITRFINKFCWSDTGLINDIKSKLSEFEVDDIENLLTAE